MILRPAIDKNRKTSGADFDRGILQLVKVQSHADEPLFD